MRSPAYRDVITRSRGPSRLIFLPRSRQRRAAEGWKGWYDIAPSYCRCGERASQRKARTLSYGERLPDHPPPTPPHRTTPSTNPRFLLLFSITVNSSDIERYRKFLRGPPTNETLLKIQRLFGSTSGGGGGAGSRGISSFSHSLSRSQPAGRIRAPENKREHGLSPQ